MIVSNFAYKVQLQFFARTSLYVPYGGFAMPASFDRIRKRTPPIKVAGVVPLGKKFPWNTNTKSWHPTPNQTLTTNLNLPYIEAQITGDELHSGPPYREGGPFKSLYINRIHPYGVQGFGHYFQQTDANPSNWQKYVGGFAPPGVSTMGGAEVSNLNTALSLNSLLFPDLTGYGGKAWSKTKPKLEKANLAVSLAEARDLPRMLRTTAEGFHRIWKSMGGSVTDGIMSPKHLADQFLNEQFGWVPFLSDLRKLYATYHGSEHYMKRVSETNGKPTRRRSTLVGIPVVVAGDDGQPRISWVPDYQDTIISSGSACIVDPVLPASYFTVSPTWTLREIVETKVTATGKFSFYRPEFDTGLSEYNSSWTAIQRQLTMYGARITPSNIYRATPWTWLIDWFINVGDHFDLLTDIAVDSIVCQYLYLSAHKRTIRRLTQTLPFHNPGNVTLQWEYIISTKERVGASSPYGFSLSWDTLTPRQMAIIGALGLSRRRPAGG